ncbi:MAG: hypothetical protein US49_C0009G0023 [candidate division TM6 bacterium GW2011_GWF2_37_49]|nr:MAG: hypothetical protein US49_C0009G0023 [candidate division TM6 bacterium GW2011_GWF2_37_49]
MEKSIWHEYAYQKLDLYGGHKVRSHFDVTPFYQASTDKHDTGAYFGIGKGNGFQVAKAADVPAHGDIVGGYLIHNRDDQGEDASLLAGKVTFDPKQDIWGVRLDFFQDIDHPYKNLFFRASMPIVYVQNDMGMEIKDGTPVTFGSTEFSLADFFAGNVEVTEAMDAYNQQSALTKGKINGKRSKVGLGDIELGLGYKFHQTKKSHLFLSLGLTVPVEEESRGEYLFDAVTGNGNHVGLGVRMDSGVQIWENKHAAVRALFDLDYHYLFSATEDRTVTPKSSITSGFMSQYYLAGFKDQTGKALFPAANILTRGVRVEPGSQLEAMLALSFKSGGFVIDLGYDFYYKDEEKAWIKGWQDGMYGISATDYDASIAFDANQTIGGFLTKDDLNVESAKTPSQTTHKIFAGLGYQFNIVKKCPALAAIGGSYEFAQDNSALEQYALWLKLGISF